jgi:DNA gyrase subunit A
MSIVEPEGTLLTVTDKGFGKRSAIDDYRMQSRGGKGIINIRKTARNGEVVGVRFVRDEDEVMVITAKGMLLRLPVKDFGVLGRATQGVRVIQLEEDDHVVGVAKLEEKQDEVASETTT